MSILFTFSDFLCLYLELTSRAYASMDGVLLLSSTALAISFSCHLFVRKHHGLLLLDSTTNTMAASINPHILLAYVAVSALLTCL